MTDSIFVDLDKLGEKVHDKREAEEANKEQAKESAEEAKKATAQHEEDKRQGMI